MACSKGPHLNQCGHRVYFVQVLQDAFHQVSHRHANGPGSVALQLNNIIGSTVHTSNKKTVRTGLKRKSGCLAVCPGIWDCRSSYFVNFLLYPSSIFIPDVFMLRIKLFNHHERNKNPCLSSVCNAVFWGSLSLSLQKHYWAVLDVCMHAEKVKNKSGSHELCE